MGELPKGRGLGIRYDNHLSIITTIPTFIESAPGAHDFSPIDTVGATYFSLIVHHIVQGTVIRDFYGGGIWNRVFTSQNQRIGDGGNYFGCFFVTDYKYVSVVGDGLAALIGHGKSQA